MLHFGYQGGRLSVAAIAARAGLDHRTVYYRLHRGWSVARTLAAPKRGLAGERVQAICLRCGCVTERTPAVARKRKFCSARCANEFRHWGARKVQTRARCKYCHKYLRVLPSQGRKLFCSAQCLGRSRVGSRSASWRGGVTHDGAHWKRLVRKAAGYQCALCGKRCSRRRTRDGKLTWRLHVHHWIPRELGGDHSEANLVPLCPRCHGRAEAAFYVLLAKRVGVQGLVAAREKLKRALLRSTNHRVRYATILERRST